MGENNSKWSNWQKTNLKNIQAIYAAQLQKTERPNQKVTIFKNSVFLHLKMLSPLSIMAMYS